MSEPRPPGPPASASPQPAPTEPARRFAVVGTAGHIDHGKTSLVRLLTGVDTDRLKEEKERGISIDLGFARLPLPGNVDCGIVDVPGHERFVRNMLAGVGGIDAVLLVIAADEGVMPQTREHFDIIRLLDVTRGVVALTKIDMVEPDWLAVMAEEVRDYLKGTPFAEAPIVPVSNRTGEGAEAVRAALARVLEGLPERRDDQPARLPIDRVFSVEGFGTVVTGTLWRGTLRPGDRVVLEPPGIETRVRGVQVHNRDVAEARAGQRTAVALHGVERARLSRGDWVLRPGSLTPSYMVDARLHLLADAARPVAQRQRLRFHLGASEVIGRVILLDREELAPGESAVVQFRLEAPLVADRGDRFVVRTYSPQRAIGGGTVLVPNPEKHRRHDALALARLEVEEGGGALDRVAQALAAFPLAASAAAVAERAALPGEAVGTALEQLGEAERAVPLPDGRWLAPPAFEALAARLLEAGRKYQGGSVYRWGQARGELKRALPREADATLFDALVEGLLRDGRLFRRGERFRVDTPEQPLGPAEADLLARVEAAYAAGGFSPPTVKELDEALRPGKALAEILASLVSEGRLVRVTSDLYYPTATMEGMEATVRAFFKDHNEMRISDLKDLFGQSRKHAVPALEHFDRVGLTRRLGDIRVAGRGLNPE